eukprot:scaffold55721_cov51-Phaeocystis_antarctica.AAC.2
MGSRTTGVRKRTVKPREQRHSNQECAICAEAQREAEPIVLGVLGVPGAPGVPPGFHSFHGVPGFHASRRCGERLGVVRPAGGEVDDVAGRQPHLERRGGRLALRVALPPG